MTPSSDRSSLQRLALKWRTISLVLLGFARQISMFHKMGAHSGGQQALMLEAALLSAAVQISADISRHSEAHNLCSNEDERALTYLHTMRTYLLVLALLIRQLGADLLAAGERARKHCALAVHANQALPLSRVLSPAFLDSS